MNKEEFQIQVYPLKNKLFRFSKRMLEQGEEAEDVVQDVFVRLWMKRDNLDQYRSLEALAMITAKNLCLDRIRKRKYPVESMDDRKSIVESLPAEQDPDHSDELQMIRNAMNELGETQRMIMQLRDIEGYEFGNIGEILGMNENAVRVNLFRARKKIREMIEIKQQYEYKGN